MAASLARARGLARTAAGALPPRSAGAGGAPANPADRRTERLLRGLAVLVLALIAAMLVFVFAKAWPSFAHNGLAWFASGGNVDRQLTAIFNSPADPHRWVYEIRAWPLLYATALVTAGAVILALPLALLAAVFITEFAPRSLAAVLRAVVRLLAAVPSVVYGLIGILVLVPFVDHYLISDARKASVAGVVQLDGSSVLVATIVLTVMIAPIMIAITCDALAAVPRLWLEGALALGVNRWRVMRTVALRAVRPAVVAATVLAVGRALGEAIMLSMVSGSVAFAPNPLDGLTFFFEPARPLAATIVDNAEGLSVKPFAQTLYSFAAVLLVSTMALSFIGWRLRRSLALPGVGR